MISSALVKWKRVCLDDVLTLLSTGFLRGGTGFLKSSTGDMIKGGGSINREIRVGVTHVRIVILLHLFMSKKKRNV